MDTEDFGEVPMYLAKALGIYHGGGQIIESESDEFHLLEGLSVLTKLEAEGHQCQPVAERNIFAQVTPKSNLEIMAQAKLALTGTPLDAAYFESRDPAVSLEDELAAFLSNPPQPAFGHRIKDIFNDVLQVRSFEPGLKNAAIQLRGYNQFDFFECATPNARNCCKPDEGPCGKQNKYDNNNPQLFQDTSMLLYYGIDIAIRYKVYWMPFLYHPGWYPQKILRYFRFPSSPSTVQ